MLNFTDKKGHSIGTLNSGGT